MEAEQQRELHPVLRVRRKDCGWAVFSREGAMLTEVFEDKQAAVAEASRLSGPHAVVLVDEPSHVEREIFRP